MIESLIASVAVMGFLSFVTLCVVLIVKSRRQPDTRQPMVRHDLQQEHFADSDSYRLNVTIYEPSRGEFGPSWRSNVKMHYTWHYIPSEAEVDERLAILTDEAWEAYRVITTVNEKA